MNTSFVEVALNGPWGTRLQPGMPAAPQAIIEQAISCVRAGASVVHFHAYGEDGRQSTCPDLIAGIVEGIRREVDVIIYPAIHYMPNERSIAADSGQRRYEHYIELTRQGHADWLIVDPGSTNLVMLDDDALAEAVVDINTPKAIEYGMRLAASLGLNTTMAIYDPGYLRLAAKLQTAVKDGLAPVYRFMFSEQLTFGFPPRPYALDAFLALYAELGLTAPWMVAGLGVDLTELAPRVVRAGGHLRVGLEDYLLGTTKTNEDLMRDATRIIEDAGHSVGTAAQLRQLLS